MTGGRGGGTLRIMGPAAALLALLCAPAEAATYLERRDALIADYQAETRNRLKKARGHLEVVQELMLTPHASDGPAEAALLHLDLAEAALTVAGPTLARLPPTELPVGWTPLEDRLAAARGLLKDVAPELDAVYDRMPLSVGPLERNEVGVFEGSYPRVLLRGYYSIAAVTPEYLVTLMAHEAAHALQWEAAHARGERFSASLEDETQARRREAEVWKAIGAPREKDSDGAAAGVAAAVEAGEDSLKSHVAEVEVKAREWEWVTPAVEGPARRSMAAPAGVAASVAAEEDPAAVPDGDEARNFWLDGRIDGIRADFSQAALRSLDAARAVLGTTVELAAPFPKIVNFELVQVWALHPKRYPPGIHAAFQAIHPAVGEIDKARAALAAATVSPEDRALLERYSLERATLRDWGTEATRKALKPLAKTTGLRLASTQVGDAPPAEGKIVVPGAWVDRSTQTDVASAWAAHLLAHREQKTSAPSLEQEVEAVEASLRVWEAVGADARFDKMHPDRFLRMRVVEQSGGRAALRAYLKSLGFE